LPAQLNWDEGQVGAQEPGMFTTDQLGNTENGANLYSANITNFGHGSSVGYTVSRIDAQS
jgi:hypothetical protein